MRHISKNDISKALKDRWWLGLAVFNVILAIVVVLVIAFSIQPKETQVIVHYSSFGVAGFYRDYWYFLWGYVVIELVILSAHIGLSLKLHQLKRRDLSLSLLWATIGLSVIVFFFARSIIKIAALG